MRDTLKHRLVGAAVLAAAAVLFLPSFFKEKHVNAVSTKSQIPARPELVPVEYNAPQPVLDVQPAPSPETMFIPSDSPAPNEVPPTAEVSNTSAGSSSGGSSANGKIAASQVSSMASMPLNAQGLPDAWVVQVGSFTTKEAANKLRDELQADGLKAYVRSIPSGSSVITRVYIGPKLDKAQAQSIKAQIDKRLNIKSIVTRFQP